MAEEYVNKEELIKHIDRSFGEISTPFVVRKIRDFPTADVVPKSEVEKIFEEVKALLKKNKCRTYYINGIEVSEHFSTNLEKDLAELKKKYTEGEG